MLYLPLPLENSNLEIKPLEKQKKKDQVVDVNSVLEFCNPQEYDVVENIVQTINHI